MAQEEDQQPYRPPSSLDVSVLWHLPPVRPAQLVVPCLKSFLEQGIEGQSVFRWEAEDSGVAVRMEGETCRLRRVCELFASSWKLTSFPDKMVVASLSKSMSELQVNSAKVTTKAVYNHDKDTPQIATKRSIVPTTRM
jgi:hypothetical protein